jgi:hypothetical protein
MAQVGMEVQSSSPQKLGDLLRATPKNGAA